MADEFVCDTGEVRRFIGAVKEIVSGTAAVEARLAAIRPLFSRMMADPDWLPAEFRRTPEAGGMGKGIANWLLYRDTEGTLSLCAWYCPLVRPHRSTITWHGDWWGYMWASRMRRSMKQPRQSVLMIVLPIWHWLPENISALDHFTI